MINYYALSVAAKYTTHGVIVHFWVRPGHAAVAAHQHEQGKTPDNHGHSPT